MKLETGKGTRFNNSATTKFKDRAILGKNNEYSAMESINMKEPIIFEPRTTLLKLLPLRFHGNRKRSKDHARRVSYFIAAV